MKVDLANNYVRFHIVAVYFLQVVKKSNALPYCLLVEPDTPDYGTPIQVPTCSVTHALNPNKHCIKAFDGK